MLPVTEMMKGLIVGEEGRLGEAGEVDEVDEAKLVMLRASRVLSEMVLINFKYSPRSIGLYPSVFRLPVWSALAFALSEEALWVVGLKNVY